MLVSFGIYANFKFQFLLNPKYKHWKVCKLIKFELSNVVHY
jgi:hypothetical protein